jgi:energy-converting hydrogenase A subunit Q
LIKIPQTSVKNTKTTSRRLNKPLREVDVEYEVDKSKCQQCTERPCLLSCPVNAIAEIPPDKHIEINDRCVGCVLCREACPYDAIKMKTTMAEPIRENVPNINIKLCRQCGACVQACKTGAIHLESTGTEAAHSVIDEDKCVRCGYCARVCPTEAIKYGEILPRSVVGGKAVVVNQKKCIGCMTCTRVCPSRGAINVGEISKLPYINPAYCARCEECMNVCPSTAIKYSSRKRAYKEYNKIKTMEIVSEILEKDASKLSKNASRVNYIFNKISREVSASHDEEEFEEDVTELVEDEIKGMVDGGLEIDDIGEIIEKTHPKREKTVIDENCIACGVCIDQCPINCIKLHAPLPIHIIEGCVFCGRCVAACPFDAINITEEHFVTRDGRIYFTREKIKGPREGEVVIDNTACQQCGVCVNRCPEDALSFEDDTLVVDKDKCILCAECEGICPLNAIKLDVKN